MQAVYTGTMFCMNFGAMKTELLLFNI